MAPPTFVSHAAGALPAFAIGKGGKPKLVGDVRPAKTGVHNTFALLENLEEMAPAEPAAVALAVQEPVTGPPAAVDEAPPVAPAAVADAPRWSGAPWVVVVLSCALLFFALLPVAGGSRLLSGRRA